MSGLWRPPDKRRRRPNGEAALHERPQQGSNGDRVLTPSTPAAQPRRIGDWDLELVDVTVHQRQRGDHCWVSFPGPMLAVDGAVIRNDDGKVCYASIARLRSKAAQDAFSAAIVKLIRARHPEAFQP